MLNFVYLEVGTSKIYVFRNSLKFFSYSFFTRRKTTENSSKNDKLHRKLDFRKIYFSYLFVTPRNDGNNKLEIFINYQQKYYVEYKFGNI